jgi:hypothetical protein
VESLQVPCTLQGFHRDSRQPWGGVIWQEIPPKPDLEWTWSGHGTVHYLQGIFHFPQGIQVPGLNKEWWSPGPVPVSGIASSRVKIYFGNISWTRPDIAILIIQSGFYNHSLCFSFLSRDRENLLPCIVNVYKLYLYWKLKKWSVTCDMWHMSQCFVTMLWKDGT